MKSTRIEGLEDLDLLRDRRPLHLGYDDVGQQQIDRSTVRGRDLNRLCSAPGDENGVNPLRVRSAAVTSETSRQDRVV